MRFEQIASESTNCSASQFWRAIAIWMRNPHTVNRRILASQEVLAVEISCDLVDIFRRVEESRARLSELHRDISAEKENYLSYLADTLNIAEFTRCQPVERTDSIVTSSSDKCYLLVKKLLPRNTQMFSSTLEFLFIDKKSANVVSFCHKPIVQDKQSLGPDVVYGIQHREYNSTSINIYESNWKSDSGCCDWLRFKFFPRLIKWMKNENNTMVDGPRINSLGLVSVEKYTSLYNQMKRKYGEAMVKIWPENTDPMKFVYEDVAIATYLLLLWEKERLEKDTRDLQSFVDLGCGNGLLVHILSSEGHRGTGIDLRSRTIWNLFPESTRLQVSTIVPSWDTVFPGVDWIIGNHSDELTPWIPVIAARSSYDCRFFLLPCCAYEFDGKKYRRNNAAESQYSEYMSYIRNVCDDCGFLTLTDRLRIPSTKRICFVGWERTYAKEDISKLDANIQRVINARSTTSQKSIVTKNENTNENGNSWSASFKPRSTTERTRNCTQLDRKLVLEIVNIVATHLLGEDRRIPLEWRSGETWNAGGQVEISELVKLIAPEMLQHLRKECGGLQTLLKNHNHIFCVAQGKVQLRIPGAGDNARKKKSKRRKINDTPLRKVKPCWFYKNHPDGCPAREIDCNFQH